jgi:hypothetical protein
MYTADHLNHRVVFYANFATTATEVWGQPNFVSNTIVNPPTASSLTEPSAIAFNSLGMMFVVELGNNRVGE